MNKQIFIAISITIILLCLFDAEIEAQATNKLDAIGNVGVGTLFPQQKLAVAGKVVSINSANDYYGAWLDGTSSNALLGLGPLHNQAGYLKWVDDVFPRRLSLYTHNTAANLTLQESGGNVGVGTVEPRHRLDVWAPLNNFAASFGTSLGIGDWSGIHFGYKENGIDAYKQAGLVFERTAYNSAAPGKIHMLNSTYHGNLSLADAKFTIDELGNIGMGTRSPYKKLDVWAPSNNFAASFGSTLGIGDWSGIHFGYKETNNDYYKQAGLVFERTSYNNAAPGKIHILNSTSHGHLTLADSKFTIDELGNIGVGISTPTDKLSVNGNIKANGNIFSKKIIVAQTFWPDYVFDSSYSLRSLSEVEIFITKNKHLPDMPSAKEVAEKGISVGDSQALLLKKIEELTLYLIEQDKKIHYLLAENKKLKSR
jgi:hypothetical protein